MRHILVPLTVSLADTPMSLLNSPSAQIITIDRAPPRTSGPIAVLAPKRNAWIDWVRLALAVIVLSIALLTLVPAPVFEAWLVALAVTEAGYWFAPIALLSFAPGWRRRAIGRVAIAFGLVSAALFVAPVLRATSTARELPEELARVWGNAEPRTIGSLETRQQPIELLDLVAGVPIGGVVERTFVYASDESGQRRLDVYTPAGHVRGLPIVVLIHGGAWRAGSRSAAPALARYLAARGMAVIAPDYRFAPTHQFPSARDDVLAAVEFVTARSRAFGVDRNRIAFIGRSAGAQIAVSAASLRWGDPAVRGAVSLYGPLDLRWGYANPPNPRVIDGRAAVSQYLGGAPSEVPAMYDAASPVAQVNQSTPPVLMLHGARDDLVSPEHSERFAARMDWADRPYLLVRLPWATHGCDAILRGPCGQITVFAVERFLANVFEKN